MEEVTNNTSLEQTIKSQEVPLAEIPKDRPYIPIEEMFNTPEYDEWISDADVAQMQQLEASKFDIDKYSPAAIANLGLARPSQSNTTFDPVAQQNPPTLEEEGGFTRLLNESVGKGLSKLNNEAEANYTVDPIISNVRQTNFKRYYEHPEYATLGFSPFANNEQFYNENSTVWDDYSRMWGQFGSLAGTGFVSGYRSIGDFISGNAGRADRESAYEFEDAMAIGNSSRGGAMAWTNNLLLNSGYTMGIISSIALEELVLAGATALSGGVLAAPAAAKTALNAAKITKTVANSFGVGRMANWTRNMLKQLNNADAAKDLFNGANSGRKFLGKIFLPETTAAIRGLKTTANGAQNVTNFAKGAKTFGGFYKDIRSVNYALAESKLEAGMVYNQRLRQNLSIANEQNYGGEITVEQMEAATNNASEASFETLMRNAPLIYASNFFVLGNAFGGFNKSFARMANSSYKSIGRRIMRTGAATGADGKVLKNVFSDAGTGLKGLWNRTKNVGVRGGAKALGHSSVRYFAANFAEGVQEIGQEAISHGVNHYYESLFRDPMSGGAKLHRQSVNSGLGSQFSGQGLDVFMSGFLMGGVVSGPQKLFFQGVPAVYNFAKGKGAFGAEGAAAVAEQNKKEKEFIDSVVKSYNAVAQGVGGVAQSEGQDSVDPGSAFDQTLFNFLVQKQTSSELTTNSYDGNIFGFQDAKDFATFHNLYQVFSTGGAAQFESMIKDFQKLDDAALLEAFPANKAEIKSGKFRSKFTKMEQNMDKMESDVNAAKDLFPSPFDSSQMDKGTRAYQDERIKEMSWQHAQYLYMFTKDGFDQALTRSSSIYKRLAADPLFEGMAASDITVLLSKDSLSNEIRILKEELSQYEVDEESKKINKELIASKKGKQAKLEAYLKVVEDPKNQSKDGIYDRRSMSKIESVFTDYVKFIAKSEGAFINKEAITEALKDIIDYKALKGRAIVYDRTMEMMANPARFQEILDRTNALHDSYFANIKEEYRTTIENYVGVVKRNELMNQITQIEGEDVIPHPLYAKIFLETGDASIFFKGDESFFFVAEKGRVTKLNNPVIFEKLQSIISVYEAQNVKEAQEAQKKEDANIAEKNRQEVADVLKDVGVEENLPFSTSNLYNDLLDTKYNSYVAKQANLGQAPLTKDEWINKDGKNFRTGFQALRQVWVANDKLINPNKPLTPEEILNDGKFIQWLLSPTGGQVSPEVDLVLEKLELSMFDVTGQRETLEEGAEIQGDVAKEVVGDPGVLFSVVEENIENEQTKAKQTIYKLIYNDTQEEVGDDLLARFDIDFNIFMSAKEAKDTLILMEKDMGDGKTFAFTEPGIGTDKETVTTLSYGTLVYNKQGEAFVVQSKMDGILNGKDLFLIPIDKVGLSFKDKAEFLIRVERGGFAGVYSLQELKNIAPESVSRVTMNEIVTPYPYVNKDQAGVNARNEDPAKGRERYNAILSILTEEEISQLELVITIDPNAAAGESVDYQRKGFEANPNIRQLVSKYTVGLKAGSNLTQAKIDNLLEKMKLDDSVDPNNVFGFIAIQNFNFLNTKGGPAIDPSSMTQSELENFINVPQYLKDKLTPSEILAIVQENYATSMVLQSALDAKMKDQPVGVPIVMSMSSLNLDENGKDLGHDISFDLTLGKVDYDNNTKGLNDLEYPNVNENGDYLIYKLEMGNTERSVVPVTNLKEGARLKLIDEVEAQLKKQGLWNELAQGSDGYKAVVQLPNGTYALVPLKATPKDMNALMTEVVDSAQKIIAQKDHNSKDGIKGEPLKELRQQNKERSADLFISTKSGHVISLQVTKWGKIQLELSLKQGDTYSRLGRVTLSTKNIGSDISIADKTKLLLDAFNGSDFALDAGISYRDADGNLKGIDAKNFRVSFPRTAGIAQLLGVTTTDVMPKVVNDNNFTLSASSSSVQAQRDMEMTTNGVFQQTESFTDAEGNVIPKGPELTTDSTNKPLVEVSENVEDSLLDLSQEEFDEFEANNFANFPVMYFQHIANKLDLTETELNARETIVFNAQRETIAALAAINPQTPAIDNSVIVERSALVAVKENIAALKAKLQKGKTGVDKITVLNESEQFQRLLKRKDELTGAANKIIAAMEPQDIEDINIFLAWASNNLPGNITIQDIALLGDNLKAGGVRVGAFVLNLSDVAGGETINGTLYTGAQSSHRYHEAFHGIFRMLLSDVEINKYLAVAKKEVRAKLRAEGKTLESELKMFRRSANTYTNMSASRLEQEYYEEYLADEFQKFKRNPRSSNTSSEVKSLFTRILDWIKSVFTSYNTKELQTLFENIDAGKYSDAQVASNQFTSLGITLEANAIVPYSEKQEEAPVSDTQGNETTKKRTGFLYLDSVVADPMIASIAAMYLQRVSNNQDTSILRETMLQDVLNDFYVLYDPESPHNVAKSDKQKILLGQASTAIIEYKGTIKKQVYSVLNVIDTQVSEEEYTAEFFEDKVGLRSSSQWNTDASMVGGIQSTPREIRAYFASTTIAETDFFGNSELKKGERLIVPVNFSEVYNGLLKSVKNIEDPKIMLQNMYFFGQQNPQTGAAVSRILKDIGISEEVLLSDAPLPLQMKNAGLFQAITNAFENFRIDYLFTQTDNSGNVLIYSAAQRDDVNSQLDRWSQAWGQAFKKLTTDNAVKVQLNRVLDSLQDSLNNNQEEVGVSIIDAIEYDTKLSTEEKNAISDKALTEMSQKYSADIFNLTGIKLSGQFIAFSMIKNRQVKFLTPKQKALINVNKQETPISQLDILEMKRLIADDSDIFSDGDQGMNSRLRRLAIDNAPFDETIGLSVFKNAEGNLVYAHQKGTYHLKEVQKLNDLAYLEQLKEQDPYLDNNHLLNNEAFIQLSSDNQQRILRIAGTAVGKINATEEDVNDNISGISSRSTYGSFTPQEFALNLINSYTGLLNTKSGKVKFVEYKDGKTGKTVRVALTASLIRVLESSNTGDLMYMPVVNAVRYADGNRGSTELTDDVLDSFTNSIKTEYERIQRENSDDANQNDIVGYNKEELDPKTGEVIVGRAFKLHNSTLLLDPTVKGQLEKIANRSETVSFEVALKELEITPAQFKSQLNTILEAQFTEFKLELDQLNINSELSFNIKNGLSVEAKFTEAAQLLNLKQDKDYNLKQVFFSDWVNTKAINEILLGDQAVTLKNGVDAIKRAKAQNAATVTAASVISDPTLGVMHPNENLSAFVFEEPRSESSLTGESIDEADAQAYYTLKGLRYSEFGFGRLTKMQAALITRLEQGEDIPSSEIYGPNGFVSNGSMINSRKLVYADGKTFIKMSTFVLTPAYTSNPVKDSDGNIIGWTAKPNRVALHNLRMKMEAEEVRTNTTSIAAPLSAFKMLKQNISSLEEIRNNDDKFIQEATPLKAKYLGLQVPGPSNKMEMVDPTQIKNIVTSEQKDETPVPGMKMNGKVMTVGDIRREYNKATSKRFELKFKNKRNLTFSFDSAMEELSISKGVGAITPNLMAFLKFAQSGLKSSQSSSNQLEFFSTKDGEQQYDLNNPITINNFESLFLNYLSKGTLAEKIPGHTLVLVSDFGNNIYRRVFSFDENGIPERSEVIRQKQWEATTGKNASVNNTIQQSSNSDGQPSWKGVDVPKEGVVILDRLRSGVKEYDSKGEATGIRYTEMMMPSHFAQVMDMIEDNPNASIPDVIAKMFAIRIPSQDNHSTINSKMVDFMPAIYGSVAMYSRELVEISGADFDIDKVFSQIKEWYVKADKFIEYGKTTNEREAYDNYIEYVKTKVGKVGTIYNEAYQLKDLDNQSVKEGNPSAEVVSDALGPLYDPAITALEMLGLPISFDQYKKYKEKNGEPYEAPYNNQILDTKYALMGNTAVTEDALVGELPVSYTPASLDILEDLWDEFSDETVDSSTRSEYLVSRSREDNIDIDNLLGKIKAFAANKGAAIGAVVSPNQALSLLTEYKIALSGKGLSPVITIDGVTFNSFEFLRERLPDGKEGLRKQDIISSLITMATDNAKERLVAKLGLNKEALALVTNMVALGMPIKTALLLINQPFIQDIYTEAINKKEKTDPGVESIVKAQLSDKKNTDLQMVDVTSGMLREGLDVELTAVEKYSVLLIFREALQVSKFTKNMRSISDLTNGLGKDIASVNYKREQMEKLFAEDAIMDLTPIYKSDTWQSKYLEVFDQIYDELLPATFLSASPEFTDIMNDVLESVNTDSMEFTAEVQSKIAKDLLSYITIKAYQHNGGNGTTASIANLNNDFLYPSGKNSINNIVENLRLTKAGKNNFFLDTFALSIPASDKTNFTGLNLLQANTFRSLNASQKVDLQTSFAKLYGSLETKDDALSIINYMMVKDGLQLSYGTLLEAISPFTMSSYLDHIATANIALRDASNSKMKEVFGMTLAEVKTEFREGYLQSNINNALLKTFSSANKNVNVKDDVVSIKNKSQLVTKDVDYIRVRTISGDTALYKTYKANENLSNKDVRTFELVDTYGSNQQNGIGFMFGPRLTYAEVRDTIAELHRDPDAAGPNNNAESFPGELSKQEQDVEKVIQQANEIDTVVGTPSQGGTQVKADGKNVADVKPVAEQPSTRTITYTPTGKPKQEYTIDGDRILNKKGVEVFKSVSKDRLKIYANLAVQEGRAKVVTYKGNNYVVNDKNQIMSVRTGLEMKWEENNGNRIAVLNLAQNSQSETSAPQTNEETLNREEFEELSSSELFGAADLDTQLTLEFEAEENLELAAFWDAEVDTNPEKKAIFANNKMSTYASMIAFYNAQKLKGFYQGLGELSSEEEFMESLKCLR